MRDELRYMLIGFLVVGGVLGGIFTRAEDGYVTTCSICSKETGRNVQLSWVPRWSRAEMKVERREALCDSQRTCTRT